MKTKGEDLVKIKVADKGIRIAGKRAKPGSICNVSVRDAKYLIGSGRAVPVEMKTAEPENKEKDVKVSTRKSK